MKLRLKKIASIQMGYSFRTRLVFMDQGKIAVVQMKDLNDENIVDCNALIRVGMDTVKEHHLVKPGDIVFRSRGQVTTAAILVENPGPAVVAAPLLRIRTDQNVVLPDYLVWYINQPSAQALLASRAKGTSIKMISKQALESLELAIPSLEKQCVIAELACLANEEQRLLKKIAGCRSDYISTKLMQLATGDGNGHE
jgi:restriction endonuclease S subunit